MTASLLTLNGYTVAFDPTDWPIIAPYKWRAGGAIGRFYAYGRLFRGTPRVLMHQLILGQRPGKVIDHIDGDRLNNTRSNLRFCEIHENNFNRGPTAGRMLPKGVVDSKGFYRAFINARGVRHSLGRFATIEQASAAYDDAAKRLHGNFARPNSAANPNPDAGPRLMPPPSTQASAA